MTGGMGRGPQPSSAMAKTSAQPIAKVGIIWREKAEAWSLYTRTTTSGGSSAIHFLDHS